MNKPMNVTMESLMPIIEEQLLRGQSVRFAPQGISMLPMIRQNIDSVIISPVSDKLKKYDLPLYRRPNGKFILHRIVEVGDTYTCMGDNQFVKEHGVKHDQMIAVVTAFYRGDRRIEINNWCYQMYCRLWYHSRHIRRFWRRGCGWLRRHLWR